MDAQNGSESKNEPRKKTLMLDDNTIQWGETLAVLDHRGCLSNVIKYLVEREWKKRQAEVPPAPVNGKERQVAA
jgi:hypothetical protein